MWEDVQFEIAESVGAFDRTYRIHQPLSYDQQQQLIEWLVSNLSENFIFLETKQTTLAGGYSNNWLAWQRGVFKKPDPNNISCMFELRLSAPDVPIFEMVWQKNILPVDKSDPQL